jgi:hypothetical protein
MAIDAKEQLVSTHSYYSMLRLVTVAAIIGVAWAPAVVLVAFRLPRFIPLFDKLKEKGILPTFTQLLMPFARLGAGPSDPVGLGLIILLISAYIVAIRASLRGGWIFLCLFAAVGLAAFMIFVIGMILPVNSMGATAISY